MAILPLRAYVDAWFNAWFSLFVETCEPFHVRVVSMQYNQGRWGVLAVHDHFRHRSSRLMTGARERRRDCFPSYATDGSRTTRVSAANVPARPKERDKSSVHLQGVDRHIPRIVIEAP